MNPFLGHDVMLGSVALLILYACAGGQVIHGYLRVVHSSPRYKTLAALYEAAILIHLVLLSVFATIALAGQETPAVPLFGLQIPISAALWANAPVAVIALYVAASGLGDDDVSRFIPLGQALFAICCMPPLTVVLGDWWVSVFYLDALFAAFYVSFQLLNDKRQRRQNVSGLSVIESLQRLPDGLLYAKSDGRILMLNDSMRHCLTALQLPTDFANALDVWRALKAMPQVEIPGNDEHVGDVGESLQDENVALVEIGPDEVRLFSLVALDGNPDTTEQLSLGTPHVQAEGTKTLGSAPEIRIIAYDVTSEFMLIREIDYANQELVASHEALRESLETVKQVAENEAMLRMRGRVHDVIGQRLSMLHRALEDQSLTSGQLEQMKPLLSGVLDDLASGDDADPRDELQATINAFALAGVEVNCQGELPENTRDAQLFANCIREGTTNAVKHAQASRVDVVISARRLRMENGGNMPTLPVKEGTGLANMRRMAKAAGGSLALAVEDGRFSVEIDLDPHIGVQCT